MGAMRKEKVVLKLVHPGRYIEIHREPIIAEEVLRRNPRHCITRPDVFEFPWIVVKPESLLLPGRVFFIVPNHTIYNLIKAKAPSSQNQQFPHNPSLQDLKQTSLDEYSADISTKQHRTCKRFIKCLPWKMSPDIERTVQKQSQVEVWPQGIRYGDTRMKFGQQLREESTAGTRAYDAIEYRKSSEDNGIKLPKKDVNLEFVYQQVTILKSCFRKPDSVRRFLDLKVSFDLPVKVEEQREYNEDHKDLQNFLGIEIGDSDISIE